MSGEFDAAAYAALQDPDAEAAPKQSTFSWDSECQAELLAIIVNDRKFLSETAHLMEPKYFTTKYHKAIASIALDHFKKYKSPASKAVMKAELKEYVNKHEDFLYLGTYAALEGKYTPGLESRGYYRDKLLNFAQMQAMKVAWSKALDELEKPQQDWEKVRSIMKDAIGVDVRPDLGLDYFASLADRYAEDDEAKDNDIFTTGLVKLDESMNNGGMRRGELHGVMAPPGVGKSLFMTMLTMKNLLAGKKVLFVSCEMSEMDIAWRLDAMLSKVGIKSLKLQADDVLQKIGQVHEGLADKRPLIIKQFPAGMCSVDTIRSLCESLDTEGFRPDLLVVDYVGEMKLNKVIKKHEALEQVVSELHGLGVERQMCVFTAMQPNREAATAMNGGVIDASMLGDSYGQLRPLDGFYTLNQSPAEKTQNLGRLWVEKVRAGVAKILIHVQYDPDTLEIGEISESSYKLKASDHKEKLVDNAAKDVDDFFGSKRKKKGKAAFHDELEDIFAEPLEV